MAMEAEEVECIRGGYLPAESSRASNLAELIFRPTESEDDSQPIFMGTVGNRTFDVSLRALRHTALYLLEQVKTRGLQRGDTICLLRLPRTSETVIAAAYVALTAGGYRVLFPMYLEPDSFQDWLRISNTRAVLWSLRELRDSIDNESDLALADRLGSMISGLNIPSYCLWDDLKVPELLQGKYAPASSGDANALDLLDAADPESECLVLTTSGSSGRSKLVVYRQKAFLLSCVAWELAGMFQPDRLGGRTLCLLLAHSIGLRALWNALWTRQSLCLIPPEWFLEHPERVRTLLLRMRPQHVTGGPAVFRTLLELARVFPDVKESCFRDLRCGVSSGAPFDHEMSQKLEAALGLKLENAFGTTETMQVLSTLAEGPFESGMGNPLPSVAIRLEPYSDTDHPLFRLQIRSPFGCSGYLDERGCTKPIDREGTGWYSTGDLVEITPLGLSYAGRETTDFTKDWYGVKIPHALVAKRYDRLGFPVVHLEIFPVREEPGLAALIFVSEQNSPGWERDKPLSDPLLLDHVKSLIEARTERLLGEVDDFEVRHLTLTRFACVPGPPPRTAKGNVSCAAVASRCRDLLRRLTGPFVNESGFVQIDREQLSRPRTIRFTHPHRGELLNVARLDKHFTSASGDRLIYRENGEDHEVIDFVGGFGTNLIGHNHPEVVSASRHFLRQNAICISDQGSGRPHEGAFARALSFAVGNVTGKSYVVRLGSTGSEAVEMALSHAFLERENKVRKFIRDQKQTFGDRYPKHVREIESQIRETISAFSPRVLAIEGSFHGHSLGARSVLGRCSSRSVFEPLMRLETIFLPPDGNVDLDGLVRTSEIRLPALRLEAGEVMEGTFSLSRIVAAIVEPIRGEGGVHVVDRSLLRKLSAYPFPLIIDEVQCGLGRSGSFLASEGVRGNYYLFGKALGGGIAKISALLVERERYVNDFDKHYSSTFSGDAFSCAVASRVLEVIEQERIPVRARERGGILRTKLEAIRQKYPDVISAIRGEGLMLGIELDTKRFDDTLVFRMLTEREYLGLLCASYLLNRHGIRVLPILSAPNTLRIEPSAIVDLDAIDRLSTALETLCAALRNRDGYTLFSFLVDDDLALGDTNCEEERVPPFLARIEPPAPGAYRVAFLNHFVAPEREMVFVDHSLKHMPAGARRALFHRFVRLMEMKPTIAFARNLFSGRIWFASVLFPVDSAILEELHRTKKTKFVVGRLQEALEWSAALGCKAASLGAYTSIISANGTRLMPPDGLKLSTGNTLTVAVGVRRLVRVCKRYHIDPQSPDTRVAVVGASGNIGTALAHRLVFGDPFWRSILLIGRGCDRLNALKEQLLHEWIQKNPAAAPASMPLLSVSCDLDSLRDCNVVLVATGTNELLLYPHHLSPFEPVVIADLSQPEVVSSSVKAMKNVHVIPFAGTLRVPGEAGFSMASHISPGTAFSCAAEVMLMGLEPEETADLQLTGTIDPFAVQKLDELARKHGFYGTPTPTPSPDAPTKVPL